MESGFDIFWFLVEFYIADISLNAILTPPYPVDKVLQCHFAHERRTRSKKVFEHDSIVSVTVMKYIRYV